MDLHTARSAVRHFGRNVRATRLAVGMSQGELGHSSHVSPKYIGEIERGITNPSLVTMILVADALGCNLADLFRSEESSRYVTVLADDDMRRAQEALVVLRSVLAAPKRARRRLSLK